MSGARGLGRRGFTLLELVIALALSSFVLVGVMMLATTMVRQHIDTMRSGNVSSLTLYALDGMNRDIESATHIDSNYPPVGGGPTIAVCQNWSPLTSSIMGTGAIDGQVNDVYTYIYCVDGYNTGAAGMGNGNSLWRYSHQGACDIDPPVAITCGSSPNAGAWQQVIQKNMWPADAGTGYSGDYFTRLRDGSGVALNYIVGFSTPSNNNPSPSYFKASYTIHLARHMDPTNPTGND